MTGDPVIDLLISAAGIAALVAIAFVLGARRTVRVGEENARERLAFDEPDFVPAEVLVGVDGAAAAALSAAGELALVFAVGDGLVTRRRMARDYETARDGASIVYRLGEPSRLRVTLTAPSEAMATDWLARMAGKAAG